MTDERAERLRKRRKQSDTGGNAERTTHDQKSAPPRDSDSYRQVSSADEGETAAGSAETDARPGIDENDDQDSDAADSIKDQRVGTYMYLPETQTRELRRLYNLLKAEYEFRYDDAFEKNRHFYPLVVEHGMAQLEQVDASELHEHMEELP